MAGINKDQVLEVIRLIEEEGKSENAACKKVGVNRMTFRAAAFKMDAASEYARAYEALATDQIEKMEVAITDMRKGTIDPQMARVEIDARKWFASKLLPRRYGDKLDLTSGGEKLPTPIFGGTSVIENPSGDISNNEDEA